MQGDSDARPFEQGSSGDRRRMALAPVQRTLWVAGRPGTPFRYTAEGGFDGKQRLWQAKPTARLRVNVRQQLRASDGDNGLSAAPAGASLARGVVR